MTVIAESSDSEEECKPQLKRLRISKKSHPVNSTYFSRRRANLDREETALLRRSSRAKACITVKEQITRVILAITEVSRAHPEIIPMLVRSLKAQINQNDSELKQEIITDPGSLSSATSVMELAAQATDTTQLDPLLVALIEDDATLESSEFSGSLHGPSEASGSNRTRRLRWASQALSPHNYKRDLRRHGNS